MLDLPSNAGCKRDRCTGGHAVSPHPEGRCTSQSLTDSARIKASVEYVDLRNGASTAHSPRRVWIKKISKGARTSGRRFAFGRGLSVYAMHLHRPRCTTRHRSLEASVITYFFTSPSSAQGGMGRKRNCHISQQKSSNYTQHEAVLVHEHLLPQQS